MQGPDTDAQDQPPPFIHIRLATHGRSIQLGQTEKNSVRAYVFRFALKLGHCLMHSACLKGANSGHSGCAAYCEPSDASNIVQLANRKRLSSSDLANQSIGQKEGVT